ncbi:hypothetical protein ACTJIJ_20120 [Niabella sp. 22666]|uniref:hypothetical protein n=1 Tax=Niabella sp. 22666 TaxID=3453954 RepID=UPI003F87714A
MLIASGFFIPSSKAQILYPQGGLLSNLLYRTAEKEMPEHGFLPGKKFPTYSLIGKYDFAGKKIKVTLFDDRASLQLKKINCSNEELTNQTEFTKDEGIAKVWLYINKLFQDANLIIDSSAAESLEVRLQALDCREIGFGKITVHGLSQISVMRNGTTTLYCTDLIDGDKTSPLRKSSFTTRKTAMRYMVSAAIRDTIEKILIGMLTTNK